MAIMDDYTGEVANVATNVGHIRKAVPCHVTIAMTAAAIILSHHTLRPLRGKRHPSMSMHENPLSCQIVATLATYSL